MLLLFFLCLVAVNVLWLFLMVPGIDLQWVSVVFSDRTHLPFHTHGIQFQKSKWV